MWLSRAAHFMGKWLSPLTVLAGRIGTAFIAIIMLLTVADIIGRLAFQPIIGALEISELMLVIAVFGSLAYCQLHRNHVSIDMVLSGFRQRTRYIINSIMYCGFLGFCGLISWRLAAYGISEIGGKATTALQLPVYPFLFIAAAGAGLLSLIILIHLLEYIAGALEG